MSKGKYKTGEELFDPLLSTCARCPVAPMLDVVEITTFDTSRIKGHFIANF